MLTLARVNSCFAEILISTIPASHHGLDSWEHFAANQWAEKWCFIFLCLCSHKTRDLYQQIFLFSNIFADVDLNRDAASLSAETCLMTRVPRPINMSRFTSRVSPWWPGPLRVTPSRPGCSTSRPPLPLVKCPQQQLWQPQQQLPPPQHPPQQQHPLPWP